MYLSAFILIVVWIINPITLTLMDYNASKKANNQRKKSSILFNSIYIERSATPEEVFETLAKAGIKPAFLQNENNE